MDTPGLSAIGGAVERATEQRTASAERDQHLRLVHVGPKRDQAEETLSERERRFQELLNALPAAVYTIDAAGRITYFNEAAAELWGHRPVLGPSTERRCPGLGKAPDPHSSNRAIDNGLKPSRRNLVDLVERRDQNSRNPGQCGFVWLITLSLESIRHLQTTAVAVALRISGVTINPHDVLSMSPDAQSTGPLLR
jgi:hypothetical protein